MNYMNNKYSRALILVLLLQAGAYYAVAFRGELAPPAFPLSSFPSMIDGWHMTQNAPIEKEVQDVLKADDILSRRYSSPSRMADSYLFIAYFKTQRYGQAPHSPKNCLPGAGYEPIEDSKMSIEVPEWPSPIVVNKFVTERGDEKSVTLYWYQSHNRVIASEYWAKFWLVADAVRYRRSDTSLVKIVVPVANNRIEASTAIAVEFAQALFPSLLKQLPR
jgi:EpsI family protein